MNIETTTAENTTKTAIDYIPCYAPLALRIFKYSTPKEFANCEYKPFGNIPDEYWEGYGGISNGKIVAFVTKNPNELHFYKDEDCTFDEFIETIGHELGHFQSKISICFNEEKKADRYGQFAKQVYDVCSLINGA